MKSAARSGREPKEMKAPCSQSAASRDERPQHTARATPAWPFPTARLTDRLTDPAVVCPACGRVTSFTRSWCEHCAEALP